MDPHLRHFFDVNVGPLPLKETFSELITATSYHNLLISKRKDQLDQPHGEPANLDECRDFFWLL